MKKLTLRAEHLNELSTDDMRYVGGAGIDVTRYCPPIVVSAGSCACTLGVPEIGYPSGRISDGSCVCFC